MTADDGHLVVASIDEHNSRTKTVQAALSMKRVSTIAHGVTRRAWDSVSILRRVLLMVEQSLRYLSARSWRCSSGVCFPAARLIAVQGNYLAEHKIVDSIRVPEFKLMPLEGARGSTIPFNIDGDPVDAASIHVKVLHQRLRVFCLPLQPSESTA